LKNAVLLFLSEIHLSGNRLSATEYDTEMYGKIKCDQTNEASVKYLMRKLAVSSEKIDRIFAFSTKKTQEDIRYTDAEGHTVQKKQRDIFEENIIAEYPVLEGCITYVDFDENCDSRDMVKYVLKMASTMDEFMGDEVADWVVHSDLTGGMRHAAILMMSVLHLLKYRGIKIGEAVYANYYRLDQSKNRIEDVSGIHQMFELVSSTDSFFNYGTLREIDAYFSKVPYAEKSDELRRLLDALREFSDAVKVCRTGKFEPALNELYDSLEKFKAYGEKSAHEALFSQILGALEKDYRELLSKDRSRIDIIRWCIRKGYLQQAMTLFNEWMPKDVVRFKLYYPNPLYAKQIYNICLNDNKGYKKFENVFVDDFYSTVGRLKCIALAKDAQSEAKSSKFFAGFRELMRNEGKSEYPENIDNKKLERLISEIGKIDGIKQQIKRKKLTWGDFKKQHPDLFTLVRHEKKSLEQYRGVSAEDFFIENMNCKMMYKYLANEKEEFLYTFFRIRKQDKSHEEKDDAKRNSEESINKQWENRWEKICEMLDDKVVLSVAERNIVESVIGALFWIRKQRNQINHAYSGLAVADNAQLEERMMNAMALIEKVSADG